MNNTVLTINNKSFTREELLIYSKSKAGDEKTPSWDKAVYQFILNWFDDSETIVQFSSGTTGKSKELHLSKQSMIRSAENTCTFFDLKKGQTAVLCLPVDFIAGKMMIIRCIAGGLNLQLIDPKGNPDLSGVGPIDFIAMVPHQVQNTLLSVEGIPAIKKLIIGGAEIHADLERKLSQHPGEIYATYGMAETCSHVAVRRINGQNAQLFYRALPGIKLDIDDRNCLVIDAQYLPGRIITNDIVELSGNNSFRWIGRYDNLINLGGIKIVPEELEAGITAETGLECAVVALPDKLRGQKLILIFERGKFPSEEQSFKIINSNKLFRHLQAKDFIYVDKFPRNNSLKIDRRELIRIIELRK